MQELLDPGDVYVPLTIAEDKLHEGALQLLETLRPHWSRDNVTFRMFTDGITNKLVGCTHRDSSGAEEIVLVRVYGNKTDLFIDRKAELRNFKVLHKHGLAPDLYGVFENGLAYEFLQGVTLTPDTVIQPKIWKLVARVMAKMHKVDQGPKAAKEPLLWEKIEKFLALLPEPFTDPAKQERFSRDFGNPEKLRREYESLKARLIKIQSPLVFAHNDLLLVNVLYNEAVEKVTFIDYEYGGSNYQAFDIANHFAEFTGLTEIDYSRYPSKKFQLSWLSVYLEEYEGAGSPSPGQVQELYVAVNEFVLATHFLWGVWALIQYELSNIDFDYGEFAATRFKEYYRLKTCKCS